MQRSFLVSKFNFKVFYRPLLFCLIIPTILSFINNSFLCDKRDYNYEISQYATYICNNPNFHKYIQGITLLYALLVSLIFVLPITSALIITTNKKLKLMNKLKKNTSVLHESYILFSSLPIRENDLIRSCYINSFSYLLAFLLLFQSNNIIISFRTSSLYVVSLNTLSLALVIGSLIISTFIWIRLKSDSFSIFITNCWQYVFTFYPLIMILYFTNDYLQISLYNLFNSSYVLTNLIIGTSLPLFLLSIIISFSAPYFSYKSII